MNRKKAWEITLILASIIFILMPGTIIIISLVATGYTLWEYIINKYSSK